MPGGSGNTSNSAFFLPDFCAIRMVFSVVVAGELLAFVLTLAPNTDSGNRWGDLAFVSLFIQWVGLTSAGLLCVSRRWLERLGNASAAAVSYGLVLVVTAVLSEAAYWLVEERVVNFRLAAPWRLSDEPYWFVQQRMLEGSSAGVSRLGFLLRNLGIGAIIAAVALRYFYVQFQRKANLESEAQARVQALQSRIRPHFLFNSMNTIASLTRSRPEVAEQVVEDLADLFRVSLGDARVPVTLGRELEVCRHYLRIEGLRVGERLRTEWLLDLPEDALLPALTLQPLLENAIYHGIEPLPEGGPVRIEGALESKRLLVKISNSLAAGAGMQTRAGNQMAQDNVRQRLRAFFGDSGRLDVEAGAGEYRVRVSFPYITERA